MDEVGPEAPPDRLAGVIAAHAVLEKGKIIFSGLLAGLDGRTVLQESSSCDSSGADLSRMGIALAEKILERGGDRILAEVYGRGNP